MRIAVAGGTGLIGKLVVEHARGQGHTPVVLARSAGVDLATGAGLDAALAGTDAAIDVTNITTTSRRKALAFFGSATGNLQRSAHQAGVSHLVVLSIVGVDRVDLGYYAGKLHQEKVALAGPVPATVLRATQFHEFATQMLGHAVGPIVAVPRMRSQPVAAREVAAELLRLATGEPQGLAPELAGPQVLMMAPLVRSLVRARGLRKIVLSVPVPGAGGRAVARGGLLPAGPGPRGTETFAQWLAAG
jgi:uncharacterized protein YbjT (DUF2867 family)